MAYIKIGNKVYNEKYLNKDTAAEAKSLQKFSDEDGFINKVKTFFGDGAVLPKLANESERYTQIRLEQEEAKKKTVSQAIKEIGASAREIVQPTYGYSREQLAEAAPSVWERTKGVAKGVGRFATDVASLVPLAIQGVGALTGSEGIKQVGNTLAEIPEAVKQSLQPKSAGEAKAASFTELGLNVIPAGTVSKGKLLSKIAKLTDASEIEKLLVSGKLVPKTLPSEDISKVAQSLVGVKDEKSILNTIYAESIFKKAELAIGKPLSTKAKMMIELSVKTTPIQTPEEGKALADAMVEKIKATIPPEKTIVRTVDTAGATIEKNAIGDVARIVSKDGKITYENKELVKALELPDIKQVDEAKAVKIDGEAKDVTKEIAKKGAQTIAQKLELKEAARAAKQKAKEVKNFLKGLQEQLTYETRRNNAEGIANLKAQIKAAKKSASQAMREAKQATGKLKTEQIQTVVNNVTKRALKSKMIVRSERTLLKAKFKNISRGAKIGKREGVKAGKEFRKAVRDYASDLPVKERRAIISRVKSMEVSSKKQVESVLKDIDKARAKYVKETDRLETLRDVLPLKKLAREKGVIGNVNARIKDMFPRFKTVEGKKVRVQFTDNMIKKLSKDELLKYKKILQETLDTTPPKIDRSKVDFKEIPKVGSSKSNAQSVAKEVKRGLRGALGVASTNIRKIGGDKLFYKLRERTLELNRLSAEYASKMEDFQAGIRKIVKNVDHTEIADALFNQDFARAREIAKKNNFEESLEGVISILEDIHARANAVGLKVGKLKNYFPRIVKDYDGLFTAYNKKFGKEGRSFLDKLLTDAAKKKYKAVEQLTDEERSEILTKALRGYGEGKINVGSVGKARQFKELPPEFLQYYHSPEDALTIYVAKMNDKITLKKIFGLNDVEQESLGSLVDGLNISPDELHMLKQSLAAVLSPQGKENIMLNTLRKSATLTLLSHVAATLFQIADIGVSAYKNGGMRALGALIDAKPFKRDELFTDILHEFSDSKAIKKSLKFVGFDRLDKLNSEAFMGAAFRKASADAKLGKGERYDELMEKLKPMFQGDEVKAKKVMDDLAKQVVNKDTQFYVFNEILDVSPRALMEMPEAYLRNPNARLFYSMKSYGLKVLDVYRNDVIYKWKDNPKKSVKNFVKLTAFLTMSGASGSQIRDWYNGKDTKFSDNVVNNLLQTMMVSSYDINNIQRDGLGRTLLSKALPPSRVIDDLSRDLVSAGDDKGLQSIRNIPIVGGEIYNRLGRGSELIEKANKAN